MSTFSKLIAASALLLSSVASVRAQDTQEPTVGGPLNSTGWYTIWNNGQNFLSVDTFTNPDDNNTHYLIGRFAPEYAMLLAHSLSGLVMLNVPSSL